MSDMWKAYDYLQDEGYNHLTVNHSLNFIDPDMGAHTQRMENTWWGIKQSMPHTGTSNDLFSSYLLEWLWRKQYGEDSFGNIIEHIAELYDVRKETSRVPCTPVCTQREWKNVQRRQKKTAFPRNQMNGKIIRVKAKRNTTTTTNNSEGKHLFLSFFIFKLLKNKE